MTRFPRHLLRKGPQSIMVSGRCIGLFEVKNRVYAIDNVCPHADALLSQGRVVGDVVECAFHNARFHLPSGRCLRGPGRDIRSYPVTTDGADVLLHVESADTTPRERNP